jgi:hypothetical protein
VTGREALNLAPSLPSPIPTLDARIADDDLKLSDVVFTPFM